MKKKALLRIVIALVLLAAAAVFLYLRSSGMAELTRYNARSMADWKLGGEIVGVQTVADAQSYDTKHFEYFTDDNGEGLKSVSSNARYYLDFSTDGNCRVIGFSTTAENYSVLGIRIGDDELASKSVLLDAGYRMKGGGLDTCRAVNGRIAVYLAFEHGKVTGMAAYIR